MRCPSARRQLQVTQNFWLSIWSEKTTEYERQVEVGAAQEGTFPSAHYMVRAASLPLA